MPTADTSKAVPSKADVDQINCTEHAYNALIGIAPPAVVNAAAYAHLISQFGGAPRILHDRQ
jgi:hypothetical protein